MRSLARNPSYRPSSAAELAAELEPGTEAPTTPLPRAASRDKRKLWWVLAGVLAVAGLLLGIGLGTRGSNGQPQPEPRAPLVQPIVRGTTPQQQARNLSAWLRRYSR